MAAIYIHVPFCRRRCSYCDFYFVTSHARIREYVDAVCAEIRLRSGTELISEPVRTIYFGGGTPSRLTTGQLGRILEAVEEHFDAGSVEEITVEVNPEDPDPAYLGGLLQIGVTRLSVGIQSLDDDDLEFMRRSHTGTQGRAFVETALATGFDSVSIDLIFGLPEMDATRWKNHLDYVASCGVQHVSLYGLTVEPRTLLGKWVRNGDITPPGEEIMEGQFRLADELMTRRGFDHYEISNFARPGYRSRHNLSYWNHSNYFGFGPSAHSFLWQDDARRWENVRNLRAYLEDIHQGKLPVAFEEQVDPDRLVQEYILLGLRTDRGVDLETLRDRYGYRMSAEGIDVVSQLARSGKLSFDGRKLILTVDGLLVADAVTASILRQSVFAPDGV